MNIGLDISQIVYKGTGSSRYTAGILNAILKNNSSDQWTFFFSALRRKLDPEVEKKIKGEFFHLKKFPIPPTALHTMWNTLHLLPIESFVNGLDWFITSDWTQPPSKAKTATLVHDLTYLKFPELVAGKSIAAQKKRLERAKEESTVFFALSESTKKDLHELLNINTDRIVVNYPGVEVMEPSQSQIQETSKKFKITKPFILAVGKIEPRKNLGRLISAFSKIKEQDIELLIAGPDGWEESGNKPMKNVRFLGYVSDIELFSLYKTCLCFAFPSLYEGFGFPAVEAMMLGAPVLLSNTSSLKEIGQDCALLFDPTDTEEITQALDEMILNESLRDDLRNKGRKMSEKFTWDKTYQRMMETLQNN